MLSYIEALDEDLNTVLGVMKGDFTFEGKPTRLAMDIVPNSGLTVDNFSSALGVSVFPGACHGVSNSRHIGRNEYKRVISGEQ